MWPLRRDEKLTNFVYLAALPTCFLSFVEIVRLLDAFRLLSFFWRGFDISRNKEFY